jgi:hypothetical protein
MCCYMLGIKLDTFDINECNLRLILTDQPPLVRFVLNLCKHSHRNKNKEPSIFLEISGMMSEIYLPQTKRSMICESEAARIGDRSLDQCPIAS